MKEIQLPPNDLNAEMSVLGSELRDESTVPDVGEVITPGDFYSMANHHIQKAILSLFSDGQPVDLVTVGDRLESMGKLGEVGGAMYLLELADFVPHSGNAVHYAELVLGCSQRRKAISLAQNLLSMAYDKTTPTEDVFDKTAKAASELTALVGTQIRTISDYVGDVISTYERGVQPTIHVGIREIDDECQGFATGEMVIVAARPSHGKTAIAVQWLDTAAYHGVASLAISLEMSPESLAARLLSSITPIPRGEWQQNVGQLRFEHREHFQGRAPVYVLENCHRIAAIEREVAKAVHSKGVKLVVIDYVQLVKSDGNRYEQVTDVSIRLKRLAVRHNVVMIVLAQLSRDIEKRTDATPKPSDLKESGQLEQDADVILMPFWPWKFNSKYEPSTEYRVYHVKNRNRGIRNSMLEMSFNSNRQKFETDLSAAERF